MPELSQTSPRIDTWQQALDYIYGLANWETRPPGTPHTFELDRIRAVLAALGDPHRRFRAVHVGGTNGKGSTCAYVASALVIAGYRVGLYTSPHLHTVRERIQVSGELVPASWVIGWINQWHPVFVAHPGMTTFEALTALAFSYFAEREVDIAVVEVGLGGRLDTTNVVEPAVSVLTPIDLDHTQVLGDSVAEIATDKAGIFKPGVPVVSAPQAAEAAAVITSIAEEVGCRVYRVGRDATSEERPDGLVVRVTGLDGSAAAGADVSDQPPGGPGDSAHSRSIVGDGSGKGAPRVEAPSLEVMVPRHLEGPHQRLNATTAVLTLAVLRAAGWRLPLQAIATGVAATKWPARFEPLPAPVVGSNLADLAEQILNPGATSRGQEPGPQEPVAQEPAQEPVPQEPAQEPGLQVPELLVDGAHNPHAARALAAAINGRFGDEPVVLLLGFTRGKDVHGVAEALLPVARAVVLTRSRHPKALPLDAANDVVLQAADRLSRNLSVVLATDHLDALSAAIRAAGPGGHIVASGSLFVAGNIRELWLAEGGHPVPPSDGPPPETPAAPKGASPAGPGSGDSATETPPDDPPPR